MTIFDFKSMIRGWEHKEPCNFGGWALDEEVVEVSESLPWREGELYPESAPTIGSREVDGGYGIQEGE